MNCDQGHPAYLLGMKGVVDYESYGDSPEHNELYRLMLALAQDLNVASLDDRLEISDLIFTWQDFCQLAVTAYNSRKKVGYG